jgi:hypothetical protein
MMLFRIFRNVATIDLTAGGFEFGGFFAHADGWGFFGLDVLGVGGIAAEPSIKSCRIYC